MLPAVTVAKANVILIINTYVAHVKIARTCDMSILTHCAPRNGSTNFENQAHSNTPSTVVYAYASIEQG